MTYCTYTVDFPDYLSAQMAAATIMRENQTARCVVVRHRHAWRVIVSYEEQP